MEKNPYIEFREVEDGLDDARVEVYFLNALVHTIENVWTRPGGEVYTEREQCLARARWAVRQLWDESEKAVR